VFLGLICKFKAPICDLEFALSTKRVIGLIGTEKSCPMIVEINSNSINRETRPLVKCFELKASDGELHLSCLRRQPTCLQPCAHLVIFITEEDLRGNTAKLVARGVRVADFAQTRAVHCSVERRLRRLEGRDLTT